MSTLSRKFNTLLDHVGLHVSKASSFRGVKEELARRQGQIDELSAALTRAELREQREQERLLDLSKSRWRADEPDEGLTWGVRMTGDEFVRFLLAHVRLTQNSTIVEIGPGYGRILEALLKSGTLFRQYVGLDISAARVNRLSENFRDPRIEFRQADILQDVELNSPADLTFSSAVFEHLYPDFAAAMNTISAFTKPGGSVVIDFVRLDEAVETAESWFDANTYIRVYSLAELKTLFSKSGFTLRDVGKISFGADIDNREITRTIAVGTKPSVAGASIESIPSLLEQSNGDLRPFERFVHEVPAGYQYATLEPPIRPEFRFRFGGFWTDLNSADAILAGKVAIGEISTQEARLINAWRRNGFVILPGAVAPSTIDAALADFEAAYDGRFERKMSFWEPDGFHIEPASREHVPKREAKLLDLHEVSEAVQSAIFSEAVNRFLHILFERPALAFQSLGFYYGSRQSIHQDSAFVRVNSALEFVASWIALEDISPGSGELEYYPGSHAVPPPLFTGERLWFAEGSAEVGEFTTRLHAAAQNAGLSLQRFIAKKGDVFLWSAGLMHGGSPVEDPELTRKSIVTHYCPADLLPMYAYKGGRPKRKLASGHYVMAEYWQETKSGLQNLAAEG